MRKIFLFFLFTSLLFTSCTDRPNIKIEGSIHGGGKNFLYLDFLNINKTESVDSVRIKKDGSFKFSFYSEYPGIYILRNEAGQIINLLPYPDEKLVIEADYSKFNSSYSVSGSKDSEYLRQLVEKLSDTREKLTSLNSAYESLTNLTEEQASDYIARYKEIIKEQRDFSIHFIIEHLSSISSIYALYQEISEGQFVLGENYDIQYMKIVADSVSKYYPDIPFVKSFVNNARESENKYYSLKGLGEKLKEAKPEDLDLNIADQNGNLIKLSSLKGKVVLLYFWSSKSADCQALNPALHQIYEKYKKYGFEVYAVGLENSKEAWAKTIKYEGLDWINVSELSFPDSKAAQKFNVRTLPASYLYNKEGEIVARNIFGQELQKWLDNLL
ncbi:MAG: AhpC/TSA family protein [Bacteroidales bacterium]|nr:AhpC/TSA family protein [Bacteroidales bacterium]MCF8390881.1 AhpC/TSA family protein [Bacteroidales bacterium]